MGGWDVADVGEPGADIALFTIDSTNEVVVKSRHQSP